MRCARVQEQLVLYLAGELMPRENARLTEHLAQCAACAAMAEELAGTQKRISNALQTEIDAPVTLDARVMAAVRALPVQQRPWPRFLPNWRLRPGYAFAAALGFIAIFGVLIEGYYRALPVLDLANLGAAHNGLSKASSPTEPRDSSLKQLTALVQFPVQASDLKSEGATLVGGRRIIVDNVAVAALHYNWEGHQISLFEMDAAKQTPSQLRQLERVPDSYYVHKVGDLAYVAWHSGRTDCVMVARAVPMHQLFHLACRACERQEQAKPRPPSS